MTGFTIDRDRITSVIQKAVRYLESVQKPNGELPIGPMPSAVPMVQRKGVSVFFGTVFCATELIGSPEADAVFRKACSFIDQDRRLGHVWGYYSKENRHVDPPLPVDDCPPDVDDTALASIALAASGYKAPPNRLTLLANRDERGRFYLWILPWRKKQLKFRLILANWRQLVFIRRHRNYFRACKCLVDDVDAGVNANVMTWLGRFAGDDALIQWFEEILRDGREHCCDSYYDDPVLIRYFMARALVGRNSEAERLLVERATAPPNAPALHIALAILVRAIFDAEIPQDFVQRLIALQSEDGSWQSASVFCFGRERLACGNFASAGEDALRFGSEAITTAFCIHALHAVRTRL